MVKSSDEIRAGNRAAFHRGGGGHYNSGDIRAQMTRERNLDAYYGVNQGRGGLFGFGLGDFFSFGRHSHRPHYGFDRRGAEFGFGVGLGAGITRLFSGFGGSRDYAGYDDPRRGYVPEQAPPSGEEVGADGRLRLGQSRVEADIPDEARNAARGAREQGVRHTGDGRDYMELTAKERSAIQRQQRAENRARDNDISRVFDRG